MYIQVVSAEVAENQWKVVRAFITEEEAEEYALKIYQNGCVGNDRVLDTRIDEIVLED